MRNCRRATAILVAGTILMVTTLGAQQTSCTHGQALLNNETVDTDTYEDGSLTVTNYRDSGGNVVRTEQENFWGDLTIVNYDVKIGEPSHGTERNPIQVISDDGAGDPDDSHISSTSDTDSHDATLRMQGAYANCH